MNSVEAVSQENKAHMKIKIQNIVYFNEAQPDPDRIRLDFSKAAHTDSTGCGGCATDTFGVYWGLAVQRGWRQPEEVATFSRRARFAS